MKWREIYSKWKNEDFMMIAAMNALRVDIDHEEMRLMIHHEYTRNMIDFCQENEKEERDEKIIDTMTIFWKSIMKKTNWIMNKEKDDILRWIESDECRKKMLRRYLNEMKRDCLSGKIEEMCDNYEKRLKEEVRMRIEERERVRRELEMKMMKMKYETDLKKMMRELREKYMIYWMNKKKNIMKHEFSSYK